MDRSENTPPTDVAYMSAPPTQERSPIMRWWYGMTAPKEVPTNAPAFMRERSRRAFLISSMTGILLIILGVIFPITLFIPNKFVLLLVGSIALVCVIALFFNRIGRTALAGTIIVIILECALLLIIATTRPFSTLNTRLFDFLLLPVVFATAFFSRGAAFLVAIFNSVFIFLILRYQSVTPEFATVLSAQYYNVLALPISLQWIIAVLFQRVFQSEKTATIRADRAEVIARLEQERAEEGQALEREIEDILQVHMQVANGNLGARANLSRKQRLYELSHALNQLLTRLQRTTQSSREMQLLQERFPALVNIVHQAANDNQPVPPIPTTQTFVDPLFRWLQGKRIVMDKAQPRKSTSFTGMSEQQRNLPGSF